MRLPLLMLLLAIAPGCVLRDVPERRYQPIAQGVQAISLSGYSRAYVAAPPPFYQLQSSIALGEGLTCTLINDRGTWTVEVPGTVSVPPAGTLRITCGGVGHQSATRSIACSSPRARGGIDGPATAMQLMGVRMGATAAMLSPAAFTTAGTVIASANAAAAAGVAGRESCDYAETSIDVYLWPLEKVDEPW